MAVVVVIGGLVTNISARNGGRQREGLTPDGLCTCVLAFVPFSSV